MLFAGGAAQVVVPWGISLGQEPVPGADVARFFPELSVVLLALFGGFAAIAHVLATSVVVLRTGVFPRWVAWLGVAVAFVLLFVGVLGMPLMLALLLWLLVVSVLLLRGARAPAAGG